MVTQFTTKDEETGMVLTRGQFTQMLFPDQDSKSEART